MQAYLAGLSVIGMVKTVRLSPGFENLERDSDRDFANTDSLPWQRSRPRGAECKRRGYHTVESDKDKRGGEKEILHCYTCGINFDRFDGAYEVKVRDR